MVLLGTCLTLCHWYRPDPVGPLMSAGVLAPVWRQLEPETYRMDYRVSPYCHTAGSGPALDLNFSNLHLPSTARDEPVQQLDGDVPAQL